MEYFSQFGQDRYLDEEVFLGLEKGVFLDIGAFDGVTGSNTLFFEKYRGWTGICIEPNASSFERLKRNRSCVCVHACASDTPGTVEFTEVSGGAATLSGIRGKYDRRHLHRIAVEVKETGGGVRHVHVPCVLVPDLLREHGIPRVHYCSIDTEGGELDILKSLDLGRFRFDVVSVENNYQKPDIRRYMAAMGYRLLTAEGDEIYRRIDRQARTWKDEYAPTLFRILRQIRRRFARRDPPA